MIEKARVAKEQSTECNYCEKPLEAGRTIYINEKEHTIFCSQDCAEKYEIFIED